MNEVSAFDAKTHFSALLDKVARGEEVLITKRGRAAARLVPAQAQERARVAVRKLKELRKNVSLRGLDWSELRDQGRR